MGKLTMIEKIGEFQIKDRIYQLVFKGKVTCWPKIYVLVN